MNDIETKLTILFSEVPADIMVRLAATHTKTQPSIPFAWMLSYDSGAALHNIRYFENGVRHCHLDFPIRIFMSEWTAAIVITFVPLAAIREAHVLEWYSTFYEVTVDDAKYRLTTFPNYPYNGRSIYDLVLEHQESGGVGAMLAKSKLELTNKGITIPNKS